MHPARLSSVRTSARCDGAPPLPLRFAHLWEYLGDCGPQHQKPGICGGSQEGSAPFFWQWPTDEVVTWDLTPASSRLWVPRFVAPQPNLLDVNLTGSWRHRLIFGSWPLPRFSPLSYLPVPCHCPPVSSLFLPIRLCSSPSCIFLHRILFLFSTGHLDSVASSDVLVRAASPSFIHCLRFDSPASSRPSRPPSTGPLGSPTIFLITVDQTIRRPTLRFTRHGIVQHYPSRRSAL